ncbi:putative F-box protein [Helianthus annuus]|nr:putative F-box protein [Helianthus annuus]KAJ0641789.1 putative F-box protein [Helianthus annuus]KAJ0645666.1 putative F-box protein [Helianthus annuus]
MANARKLKKDGPVWSNLDLDLWFLIMMQLGLVDFIAFGGVCKSWRSLAVSNWNKFMLAKQPMYLSISSHLNEKKFYLEDYLRRKLKTTIPDSNYDMICVGITCGYLIFFETRTCDFWLVNPFTRKELRFRGFPFCMYTIPKHIRCILVFSLTPEPTLTVLEMKDFPWLSRNNVLHFVSSSDDLYVVNASGDVVNPSVLEFVSSSDNLYVVNASGDVNESVEVDFGEMKWVDSKSTIGEYTVFLCNFKSAAAIKPDTWAYPWTQYERLMYSNGNGQSKKSRTCLKKMWYFPHDCLIGNESAQHYTVSEPPTTSGLARLED